MAAPQQTPRGQGRRMQPQQQTYKGWNVSLSACGDSIMEAIFQPCVRTFSPLS